MMRRVYVWQYVLMALAWLLAVLAWPFQGADLNRFRGWEGALDMSHFVRFLLRQPQSIWEGDPVKSSSIQAAWLALVFGGFMIFIFALVMVRRRNEWRAPGQRVIRALGLPLLALPLSLFAPAYWELPRPLAGLYLLAAAHVVMFVALAITPAKADEEFAFPVEVGRRSDGG